MLPATPVPKEEYIILYILLSKYVGKQIHYTTRKNVNSDWYDVTDELAKSTLRI